MKERERKGEREGRQEGERKEGRKKKERKEKKRRKEGRKEGRELSVSPGGNIIVAPKRHDGILTIRTMSGPFGERFFGDVTESPQMRSPWLLTDPQNQWQSSL
jgi:hypothetical protein